MSILFVVTAVFPLFAQESGPKESIRKIPPLPVVLGDEPSFIIEGKEYNMNQAIMDLLNSNIDLQVLASDSVMTDSSLQKYLTKYSYFLSADTGYKYQKNPDALSTSLGKDSKTFDVTGGVQKSFQSGTTLSAGVTNEYARNTPAGGPISFVQEKYNRPVMFAKFEQELLKNAFGSSDRRQIKMLENADVMQKGLLKYQMSALTLGFIADYWEMGYNGIAYENALLKLEETKNVRSIIRENVRLGLTDSFQLNYYNALVAGAESEVALASQKYDDSIRKVFRNLNIEGSRSSLKGRNVAVLVNSLKKINEEEAVKNAFANRADLKAAEFKLKNAELALSIYKNDALPSLKGSVAVTSMAQQETFNDAYSDASSAKYPGYEARLSMSYALDNKQQKTNERDGRIELRQAALELEKAKREVKDQVASKIDGITTSHTLYMKSNEARRESEEYYLKMYSYLKRGRYSADTVKNALDGLIDSRQRELQALIGYNVALLDFYLSQNTLFSHYGIDTDAFISDIVKKAGKE